MARKLKLYLLAINRKYEFETMLSNDLFFQLKIF